MRTAPLSLVRSDSSTVIDIGRHDFLRVLGDRLSIDAVLCWFCLSWNKVAVISGATGGIGSAVAKALSGTGYRLVLSGRFVPKLNALASSIQTPSVIVVGDLQGASIPETLLSKAVESFGRCDICLNNGGLLFLLRQAPHVRAVSTGRCNTI
jgi:hypothetical protein